MRERIYLGYPRDLDGEKTIRAIENSKGKLKLIWLSFRALEKRWRIVEILISTKEKRSRPLTFQGTSWRGRLIKLCAEPRIGHVSHKHLAYEHEETSKKGWISESWSGLRAIGRYYTGLDTRKFEPSQCINYVTGQNFATAADAYNAACTALCLSSCLVDYTCVLVRARARARACKKRRVAEQHNRRVSLSRCVTPPVCGI